jgi:hypothetical protein
MIWAHNAQETYKSHILREKCSQARNPLGALVHVSPHAIGSDGS